MTPIYWMHLDTVTVFACEGFHFNEMKSPSFLIRVENAPHSKCRPVVHCVCVCVCVFVYVRHVISKLKYPITTGIVTE